MSYPVNIIRDFLAALKLEGNVLSLSNDGTNTTLILENSYHAREEMSINIDSIDYVIFSVDSKNNTVIIAGVLLTALTYKVPNPFFFSGTNYIINAETSYLESEEKLPMFYMESLVSESVGDELSKFTSTPSFSFVVLDGANYEDWQSTDYVDLRLVGLRKLVLFFIESVKSYSKFGDITGARITPYYKYGLFSTNRGVTDSLFNDRLTGIVMNIDIPLLNCNC